MSASVPDHHEAGLRSLLAPNPGPFTLEGTRTYVVGHRRLAVIDPGPADQAHLGRVLELVRGAESVVLLLTHGHGDHAGGAGQLARRLGAQVVGAGPVDRLLAEGDRVETDAGSLHALRTPGHTPDHICFHWPGRDALFAGDLLLGEGDTTWVAGYPGCVADYLGSLARMAGLGLRRIYPAHGPHVDDPAERLARFEAHRRGRIAQVEAALRETPGATRQEILRRVWGDHVPPAMVPAALESLDALLDHLGAARRP